MGGCRRPPAVLARGMTPGTPTDAREPRCAGHTGRQPLQRSVTEPERDKLTCSPARDVRLRNLRPGHPVLFKEHSRAASIQRSLACSVYAPWSAAAKSDSEVRLMACWGDRGAESFGIGGLILPPPGRDGAITAARKDLVPGRRHGYPGCGPLPNRGGGAATPDSGGLGDPSPRTLAGVMATMARIDEGGFRGAGPGDPARAG